MAAENSDDYVFVDPESKEDNAEAPKSSMTVINNNPYVGDNLIEAQKEYNPNENKKFEKQYQVDQEKKCKKGKYEMHPFSKQIMNGEDNTVLCMIRRNKAPNPVVYRAKFINGDIKSGFDLNCPIESFWLKIAGGSIKNHRESGKMDDRVEVSYMESSMAYGFSATQIGKKQQYKVKFTALPSLQCTLKVCPRHSRPRLFGQVNGKECYLTDIHVTMKKKKWFGIPQVDYITLKGYTANNDTYIEHKINNK